MLGLKLNHVSKRGPRRQWVNSIAPEGCKKNLQIFQTPLRIDVLGTSCEVGLRRVPQNPTDDKSTLVQVMACCLMAPSHYLSQCWPIYVAHCLTRPQWVNQRDTIYHKIRSYIRNYMYISCFCLGLFLFLFCFCYSSVPFNFKWQFSIASDAIHPLTSDHHNQWWPTSK